MDKHKVAFVVLRRPKNEPNEMRTDPLWEFGSFGCTGCHSYNLMNPKKAHELEGVRLAFAQGGHLGFRLVHVTPPIRLVHHARISEAKWQPITMPLKYSEAPLLVCNNGDSDFPILRRYIEVAKCPTYESKFSSKFRSRRKLLEANLAKEVIKEFEHVVATKNHTAFAQTYIDALPFPPPVIDKNRQKTYKQLLKNC